MISLKQAEEAREQFIAEYRHIMSALDTLIGFLRQRESVIGSPNENENAPALTPEEAFGIPQAPHPFVPNSISHWPPIPDWPSDWRTASLKDYIAPIAAQGPQLNWTSRSMWEVLRRSNVPVAGADDDAQINNVSMVMSGMSEPGGKLIKMISGVGRRPSQYRFRNSANEKEATEVTP